MQRGQRMWAAIALLWLGLAASGSVDVRPVSVKLQASPGQRFKFVITVKNSGAKTQRIRLYYADIVQESPDRRNFPEPGTTPYSAIPLMDAVPTELTLAAGEERRLPMAGKVPPQIRGSRHGVLMIEPLLGAAGETGPVVSMAVRIGFLIDVEIKGLYGGALTVKDNQLGLATTLLEGSGLSPAEREALQGKLAARIVFQNSGDGAAWPTGWIYLRDRGNGRLVQRLSLSGDRNLRVLPKSPLAAVCVFDRAIPPGDYTVQCLTSYGPMRRRLESSRAFRVAGPESVTPLEDGAASSEMLSLTVSPERLDVPLSAATVSSRTVVVRNGETKPLRCVAMVRQFVEEVDGTVSELPGDAGGQVALDSTEFVIPARGARGVRLSISPGTGLDPLREHYWLVKVVGRPASGGDEVALGSTLVVAADKVHATAPVLKVLNLEVKDQVEYTSVRFLVQNAGGKAAQVTGGLNIYEGDGTAAVAALPLGESSPRILAGGTRQIDLRVNRVMDDKPWRCLLNLAGGPTTAEFKITIAPPPRQSAPSAADTAKPKEG